MDIPIPSQDGDIAVPLNSSYGQAAPSSHVIHHHDHHHNNHMIPSTTAAAAAATNTNNNNGGPHQLANVSTLDHDDHDPHHHAASSYKKVAVVVRYKECLKNHAAAMGGNAMDGCGEFMPSGEEGTIEALTCSACNCHRNFHRKEVDGDHQLSEWTPYGHSPQHLNRMGRKVIVGHHHKSMLPHEALVYPTGTLIASRAPTPHQMIMPYCMGSLPSESDEQEDAAGGGGGGGGGGLMVRPHHQMAKKRFRTKFTQEQKDKMLNFAEKVGWKIQRQEESVVQQFCQEIGVKRRVLKVWMHNNKHNLAKKNQTNNINPNINPSIN